MQVNLVCLSLYVKRFKSVFISALLVSNSVEQLLLFNSGIGLLPLISHITGKLALFSAFLFSVSVSTLYASIK